MRMVVKGSPLVAASSSMVIAAGGGGVAAGTSTGYTVTMRSITHRVKARIDRGEQSCGPRAVPGAAPRPGGAGPEAPAAFGPLVVVPLGLPLLVDVERRTSGVALGAAVLLVPASPSIPPRRRPSCSSPPVGRRDAAALGPGRRALAGRPPPRRRQPGAADHRRPLVAPRRPARHAQLCRQQLRRHPATADRAGRRALHLRRLRRHVSGRVAWSAAQPGGRTGWRWRPARC